RASLLDRGYDRSHPGACLSPNAFSGQIWPPAAGRQRKRTVMIIDVFNHFMPKAYFERLADLIPGHPVLTAFPRLKSLLDVEARFRLPEDFGDVHPVTPLANPPIELIALPDKTPDLARFANDSMAEICRKHRDRFPSFVASLPMNNVEASIAEADR